MKHKRFEENILVDEAYTNYGKVDKNEDRKKTQGIAKHFAESLEYDEKKKWFHQLPQEPPSSGKTLTQQQIEELRKEASSALHGDTLAYETKTNRSGSSDHQWAKTLLNKGAIGDRVAAATILIQDNPVFNLTALKNLINNVKPAKKKDGIVIIDALSELLISDLLIPDIKLRTFEQHPLAEVEAMTSGNKHSRRQLLQLWYYEDQLKELYGTYVEALNKFAHDSVEANKEKAVSAMSYLLMHHPEREKMLLTNIINKLGDPSQAVASKVIYHLCQLLFNHPNMKSVVLAEIEKMLFRTNISPRAQYYGICFLNQFFLGKDDSKIAENLIRIYFSFFKASIKKGDIDTRLMSAILTGVKRAYPFADKERLTSTDEHTNAIHKLVHMSKMSISVHALALLFHVSDAGDEARDRYYNALYRKLGNADIYNTTHSALLFNLIYKSLKQDKNSERVAAFIKRLLQATCQSSPAQACALLFLVSQVTKESTKRSTKQLKWSPEVKEEPKEEPKEDKTEDQEETAQELTSDTEAKEEKKVKIDLLKGDKKDLLLDDEEETYVDLELDSSGNVVPTQKALSVQKGWLHRPAKAEDPAAQARLRKAANMDRVISAYDPHARNPSFAGASRSALLELTALSNHFHPTVKLFAEKLLNEQLIQYSGDPLKDFAGIRFLDRFVFKNPKKVDEGHDTEGAKKVKGSHPKFAVRKNYVPKGIRSLPVNSALYLNEDVARIPVDERFLYDYLQKRRDAKTEDDDSDNDSVNSEDFNEYLDKITGSRRDDSDEELDFLSEMESSKRKKDKKGKVDESDDEIGSGDDDDDDQGDGGDDAAMSDDDGDSDGELDIQGSDEEPMGLSGDEDELQLEGSDSEDERIDAPNKSKNKLKLNLKGKDDLGSLFASAEEFSTLLEDTATNKKQGSSQAVSNTDNSSVKQLAWEEKRDRWIKGYNKKILGNKGHNKKKKNSFNKMAPKNGGKRKTENAGGAGGKKKKFK